MLNFLNNQIKNYKNRVKSIKSFTLFQKLITFVISFLGNYHFLNVYLKNNFNFIAYNDSEITKKDVLNADVDFNVNNITESSQLTSFSKINKFQNTIMENVSQIDSSNYIYISLIFCLSITTGILWWFFKNNKTSAHINKLPIDNDILPMDNPSVSILSKNVDYLENYSPNILFDIVDYGNANRLSIFANNQLNFHPYILLLKQYYYMDKEIYIFLNNPYFFDNLSNINVNDVKSIKEYLDHLYVEVERSPFLFKDRLELFRFLILEVAPDGDSANAAYADIVEDQNLLYQFFIMSFFSTAEEFKELVENTLTGEYKHYKNTKYFK